MPLFLQIEMEKKKKDLANLPIHAVFHFITGNMWIA